MTYAYSVARARAVLVFSLFVLIIASLLPTQAQADASSLTVGNYQLISSTRINRTVYEYTYKATVTNNGADATKVTATLNIDAPGVTVLDGNLDFGDVAMGVTAISSDTFSVRHDRLYAFSETALEWTTDSIPPLAPPADPQIVSLGDSEHPLNISTLLYEGVIKAPLPEGVTLDSLLIKSGVDNQIPVSLDGRFDIRMNDHATALLRAVNTLGDTVLLQIFPKSEILVQENPQITPLSTAVAIVALQPGMITGDPSIDVLVVAMLEQLPATKELAGIIADEISQGVFAVDNDYSPDVTAGIIHVFSQLESISTALGEISSVDDIFVTTLWDKFFHYIGDFASGFIKPAYADAPWIRGCSDSFHDRFTGNPGTKDDVCISANIMGAGKLSSFDLINLRTRWVALGVRDTTNSNFDVFKWIPPRHIEIPGLYDIFKLGIFKLIDTGVVVINKLPFNFSSIFKKTDLANQELNRFSENILEGKKAEAQYLFNENGSYILSTIGVSGQSTALESYKVYSGVVTGITEFTMPALSLILDINIEESISKKSSRLIACVQKVDNFIANQYDLLRQDWTAKSTTEQIDYVLGNYIFNEDAWKFAGCIVGESWEKKFTTDKFLKDVVGELLKKISPVSKVASIAEFSANTTLFLEVLFDKNLAAEDFYKVKVGNAAPPPYPSNLGGGEIVEVLPGSKGYYYEYVEEGRYLEISLSGETGVVAVAVPRELSPDGTEWLVPVLFGGLDSLNFNYAIRRYVPAKDLKEIGRLSDVEMWVGYLKDDAFRSCIFRSIDFNYNFIDQTASCSGEDINSIEGISSIEGIDYYFFPDSIKILDLSYNNIVDLSPLYSGLYGGISNWNLEVLNLSGNNNINCSEVDAVAFHFPSVNIIRPEHCLPESPLYFQWPVESYNITQKYSAFGDGIPVDQGGDGGYVLDKYHTGMDITSNEGNLNVYAAADGYARALSRDHYINDNHRMGNTIIIDHNNGKGPFTLYAHLESFDERFNQSEYVEIKKGDRIGKMGTTGCESLGCGVHLHFEIKQKNSLGNLDDDKGPQWGYHDKKPNLAGYLNPYPYLENGFVKNYRPRIVKIPNDQIIRTGPSDDEYKLALGNVKKGQLFVATQQREEWYEIDFPSSAGPAKGWVQAELATGNVIMQVINNDPPNPDPKKRGINVLQDPATTGGVLSTVWDKQYIVKLEGAPAGRGCGKPWIKTTLVDNQTGWACSDYIFDVSPGR